MNQRVSLALALWPNADRQMWDALTRGGGPLDDLGALSHLKPVSLDGLCSRYGLWLAWLHEEDPAALLEPPANRATPARLRAWLAARSDLAPVSQRTLIDGVVRILSAAMGEANWELHQRLRRSLRQAASRSTSPRKVGRVLSTSVLLQAGLDLAGPLADAASTPLETMKRRRDGAMIATLALVPLRGRVEAGLSGGGKAYGYDVVRRIGEDGLPVTGERAINPGEAGIVRRVFRDFADGLSPKAIAHALNDEGIPGPRGKLWRDTAIRGHRARGTGLLNNELYIGRLVWNRMRYVKDPATGKRVSRLNPERDWIVTDVPELRIVEGALWEQVKARQSEIDASPAVQGIKRSRFWEKRRKTHLLTGLLVCGACGGTLSLVGKDYLACANARKLGTCDHRQSYKRDRLEAAVLDLLKDRLMKPDAVAAFVKAFSLEVNAQRGAETATRKRLEKELDATDRKVKGLYDAIADGFRTPGLLTQVQELEARKADLDTQLQAPPPSPVRLHPNLSELYRRKVAKLAESLADEAIRAAALDSLRGLIERVTVREGPEAQGVVLELEGAIRSMIEEAQPGALRAVDPGSVEVVAGVGFEPTTFRL